MMRCNDYKCHEAFLRAIHDCMICFSEFPGTDFIKLPCHHFFCSKCMQTYCKMHVKEGTVVKLLCPDTKCGIVVPPNILKRLLGEEEFERWEGLLLQRTLDSMSDVVYCPRCETACLEDADNEAVCSGCLFSFCTLCRDRRHVGDKCVAPEEKLLILEPEFPEEQLRSNDQLQEDEMLALEAIYGDNIGIFSTKDGLRCFQVYVHCKIPDGISVSAELSSGDNHDRSSLFLDKFSVQHLAPISLTCLMPPYFTLFTMSSALSHLGFDDGIVIRQPDSTMSPVDVRAVAEIVSVESVVQWLISYNEEQCHESFLIGLHDCMICFTEYAGVDFIKLPCGHYFCRRCTEMYSRMHVTEGTVLKLLCPNDKCGGVIPPSLLKRLLGDTDFERWERLLPQETLDSMSDVAYCPRCGTACLEDKENNAQCSKCFFSFCTRCRDRRHIGLKCITPEEKLLSLQDRKKVHQLSKGNFARRINLANEISSIKEVLRSSVLCPNCGTAISRVDGCNHMLCRNCRQPFCYGCGKSLHPGHSRCVA